VNTFSAAPRRRFGIFAVLLTLLGAAVIQTAASPQGQAQAGATCSVSIEPTSQSWPGGYNQKIRVVGSSNSVNLTIGVPQGHAILSGWSAFAGLTRARDFGRTDLFATIGPDQLRADNGYLGGITFVVQDLSTEVVERPTYTCEVRAFLPTCSVVVEPTSQAWAGGYNQKIRIVGEAPQATITIALPEGHTITGGWSSFADTKGARTQTVTVTTDQLRADNGFIGGFTVAADNSNRPSYSCSSKPPVAPSEPCSVIVEATSQAWAGGYNQKIRITGRTTNTNLVIELPEGHSVTSGWSTFARTVGTGALMVEVPTSELAADNGYLGGFTVTTNGTNLNAVPTYRCGDIAIVKVVKRTTVTEFEDARFEVRCDNGYSSVHLASHPLVLPIGADCITKSLEGLWTDPATGIQYSAKLFEQRKSFSVDAETSVVLEAYPLGFVVVTVNAIVGPDGAPTVDLFCAGRLADDNGTTFAAPGKHQFFIAPGFPCIFGSGANRVVLVPSHRQVLTVKSGLLSE
jgi:hypothetical protein